VLTATHPVTKGLLESGCVYCEQTSYVAETQMEDHRDWIEEVRLGQGVK
jgi:hypothetical protein